MNKNEKGRKIKIEKDIYKIGKIKKIIGNKEKWRSLRDFYRLFTAKFS